MAANPIEELTAELRGFARARDWEQFHTPKNLAMSMMIEAAEVAEHFQWTAGEAAPLTDEKREEIALEIGDTLHFLLRLADVLGIDPVAAARRKMAINEERYPVEKAYGRSLKYDRL
jgi:NTP pyrophosphatase (non-canonical NTP hydrolase)